jgi:hypothetical protein
MWLSCGWAITKLLTNATSCLQVEFVEGDDEDMSDMEDYEGEYEFDGGEDMEEDDGVLFMIHILGHILT